MEQIDRVKICKRCSNRKFDMNKGVLCGLTSEVASFNVNCSDYLEDSEAIIKEDKLDAQKDKYFLETEEGQREELKRKLADLNGQIDPALTVKRSANWFYWIAALSLINSAVLLTESDFGFIAGLGFTQMLDGMMMEIIGSYNFISFLPSLVVSILFAFIGYLSKNLSKGAYIIGMILYALDSLLFFLTNDFLFLGFHVFVLFMMYSGYKHLGRIEPEFDQEALDSDLEI